MVVFESDLYLEIAGMAVIASLKVLDWADVSGEMLF
jgi:hypothetical protein